MKISKLFNKLTPAAVLIASVLLAAGCSKDASVVALYGDGQNAKKITIGDIKTTMLRYSMRYGSDFITNEDWQKEFIFRAFIAPEIAVQEELDGGYTNTTNFEASFLKEYNKDEFGALARKGYDTFTNMAKKDEKQTYEVAHPAHIMIALSRTTNLDKIQVGYIITNGSKKPVTNHITVQTNLSDKDYAVEIKEKQAYAADLINKIKNSGSRLKMFQSLESNISGEDKGVIARGVMPGQYDDAVFSSKTKGLLDTPVTSDNGIYIIYIIAPAAQLTMNRIEQETGKDNFRDLEQNLYNIYFENSMSNNIKEYYSLDTNKNTINIGGKMYEVSNIPGNAVILDIFGRPLSWTNCVESYLLFQPFMNMNMKASDFIMTMNTMKKILFFTEFAKKNGMETDKNFVEQMASRKKEIIKGLAFQDYKTVLASNINLKIDAELTPKAVSDYYETNRQMFTKKAGTNTIRMSFNEAKPAVRDALKRAFLMDESKRWKEEMEKKTKVVYNKSGIDDLKALELDQMKDRNKNFGQILKLK